MKESICDYWDSAEPPKTYTDWLFEYFKNVSAEDAIKRLKTVCADSAEEISCFIETRMVLRESTMPLAEYCDKFHQNNERLLYAMAKLSFALDLSAVAYSVRYKRTLDAIQAKKEEMLNCLLSGMEKDIETSAYSDAQTTDAAEG